MKKKDYSASITVDATPQEAFKAINSVTKWWTENLEGGSTKLNDEFTVRFGDVHVSTQKLVEVVPGEKVEWLVTYSNISFAKNKAAWTDTKCIFDLSGEGGKTKITFTHVGLVPGTDYYAGCSGAWEGYIKESLFNLITDGEGMPEPLEN